jgi:hypothetical protein
MSDKQVSTYFWSYSGFSVAWAKHYHGNDCIILPGSHCECTHDFTGQIARVRGSKPILFLLFLWAQPPTNVWLRYWCVIIDVCWWVRWLMECAALAVPRGPMMWAGKVSHVGIKGLWSRALLTSLDWRLAVWAFFCALSVSLTLSWHSAMAMTTMGI